MILLILLNLILLIICLAILLVLMYQFQIKEYRYDRVFTAIKEKGLIGFLVPDRLVLPKKSVRNYTIVFIVGFLLAIYEVALLAIILFAKSDIDIILLLLLPFMDVAFFMLAVAITGHTAAKKRAITINAAITKRNASKAVFIGITGSYGKSTTKDFTHALLAQKYKTGKTLGNYNTPIGVAMSINSELKDDTQYFVTEMGAYKIGEVKSIADFVKPSYAIITGLSNQHLGLFGSHENLIKAKSELIQSLPQNGKVYINADSAFYTELDAYVESRPKILFSLDKQNADIFVNKYKPLNNLTEIEVNYHGVLFSFATHLLGKAVVSNLLGAIALAYDLGVSVDDVQQVAARLTNGYGKLSQHTGAKNMTFLYDGYSANVEGFLAALDVIANFANEKKYVVTKGIIELGADKAVSYQKIIDSLKQKNIRLVTTDKYFSNFSTGLDVTFLKNEDHILKYINQNLDSNSVLLIEGRFSDKFVSALNIHE